MKDFLRRSLPWVIHHKLNLGSKISIDECMLNTGRQTILRFFWGVLHRPLAEWQVRGERQIDARDISKVPELSNLNKT